jgi:hypothetical protein
VSQFRLAEKTISKSVNNAASVAAATLYTTKNLTVESHSLKILALNEEK